MKLRLRSLESKETLRIEVTNWCTLSQLKQILSQSLSNSPSPASIRLSLNRKDELQCNTNETLHSLGVISGDLIFYSLVQPASGKGSISQKLGYPGVPESSLSVGPRIPEYSSKSVLPVSQKSDEVGSGSRSSKRKFSDLYSQVEGTDADKSFSVPGFLRKIFMEELGDDSGADHKLIVIAVHAVMLESGFVGFDPSANAIVNGFPSPVDWPSGTFRLSLFYTLPDIVNGANGSPLKCVLKFQNLGKFMNVYGSLSGGLAKSNSHWLNLNEDKLVPFLNVVWANYAVRGNVMGVRFDYTSSEKKVFEFWRVAKDNLALPLLIDISEKAGLPLPPCFMRLPTDLIMKILESLPGIDVAKVGCACSELWHLASTDDLWKLKFEEECDGLPKGQCSWKMAFARVHEDRKRIKLFATEAATAHNAPFPWWSVHQLPYMMHHPPNRFFDLYGNECFPFIESDYFALV